MKGAEPTASYARARRPRGVALVLSPPAQRTRCQTLADDDLGLYVLAEGHGRGPAAEVAATATIRACVRARALLDNRALDAAAMRLIFETAATELHHLRTVQRVYVGMASSAAVLLVDGERATLGIAGDCLALLDRDDELQPQACGQSVLLGLNPRADPSFTVLARRPGDRILLTAGSVLEYATEARDHARGLSPEALIDASRARAPRRVGALVSVLV